MSQQQEQKDQNNKKSQMSKQEYYNKRFPKFFEENFYKENERLQEELKIILSESIKNNDIDTLQNVVKPSLEKLSKVYQLSSEFREFLLSLVINLIFEENTIGNGIADVYLDICKYAFRGNIYKFQLQIDWFRIYKVFENKFMQNDLQQIAPLGFKGLFHILKYFVSKIKFFFTDESIDEVFEMFKSKLNPIDSSVALFILSQFFKLSNKIPIEKYQNILDQIMEIKQWKTSLGFEDYFNYIIFNFTFLNQLDLYQYKDLIFNQFQKYVMNLLPSQGQLAIYKTQQIIPAWIKMPSQSSIIAQLIVKLMVNSQETEKFEQVWQNVDKMFHLMKPFVHPNNSGKWVSSIISFIQKFVYCYIRRNAKEQQIRKNIYRIKKKLGLLTEEDIQLYENLRQNMQNIENIDNEDIETVEKQNMEEKSQKQNEQSEEQQEEFQEELDEEEDIEITEDSDESDMTQEEIQEKKQKLLDYIQYNEQKLLDDKCHDRFMDLMDEFLVQIIYLDKTAVSLIIKYLCQFKGERVLKSILPKMYELMSNNDSNLKNIIMILYLSVDQLLNRQQYKEGIYEVINILQVTSQHLSASNFSLTQKIWRLYDRIFSILPIHHPEDMLKQYEILHDKKKGEDEFREELNKNESIDMWEFYIQYCDLSLQIFKKYIQLFEFIELSKPKQEANVRVNFLSVFNKFWSFVFQLSDQPFVQSLKILSEVINSKINRQAQKYIAYLIHSFTLRDAELTLKYILPVVLDQIICKRIKKIEDIKTLPLYQLVEFQENYQENILNYQLEELNENSLMWYIDIIEDCMQFSGLAVKKYDEALNRLVILCLQSEEKWIFQKGIRIAYKMIVSLISVYIKDLRSYNYSRIKETNGIFHNDVGQSFKQEFEVEWQQPGEEERKYAKQIYDRIIIPTRKNLNDFIENEKQDKNNKNFNIENDFDAIIDNFYKTGSESTSKQKDFIANNIFIVEQLSASITLRSEVPNIENDQNYQDFKTEFLFDEYKNEIQINLDLVQGILEQIIKSDLILDIKISTNLLQLINLLLGFDDYNSRMIQYEKQIRDNKLSSFNPYTCWPNNPRILNIQVCYIEFYKRIFSYTYMQKISSSFTYLQKYLLLFQFHPYDKISMASISVLIRFITSSQNQSTFYKMITTTGFKFLEKKLDTQSPEFLVNVVENQKEQEIYLRRTINAFRQFLKIINQYLQSQVDLVTLQPIFKIFSGYDSYTNDIAKKFLLESFPQFIWTIHIIIKKIKRFSHKYQNELENTDQNNKLIISQKENLKQDIENITKSLHSNQQQVNILKLQLQFYQNFGVQTLKDDQISSRKKSLIAVLMLLASFDIKPQQDIFYQQQEIFSDSSISSDYTMRNIGRSSFFRLLRLRKKEFVKNNQYQNNNNKQISLEEFQKNRFQQENHMQYLKQSNEGFYNIYNYYSTTDINLQVCQQQMEKDSFFKTIVSNKENCEKFIQYILQDVNTAKEFKESGQQRMNMLAGPLAFLSDINALINPYFNIDIKKENLFKKTVHSQEFYMRLFKKLFQFYGYQFFQNSKEQMQIYLKDLNKKEYQNMAYSYIIGLLRALCKQKFFWDSSSQDVQQQIKEMMDFAVQNIINCIQNTSKDDYMNWKVGFSTVTYTCTFEAVKPVWDALKQSKFSQEKDDFKYQRYLDVSRIFIRFYGLRHPEIVYEFLEELIKREPSDDKQITQYGTGISDILLSFFLEPLNIKDAVKHNIVDNLVQQIDEQKNNLVWCNSNKNSATKRSPEIKQIIEIVVEKMRDEKQEIRKKYGQLSLYIVNVFKTQEQDENTFYYFKPLFKYFIEFNEEDYIDPDLKNKMVLQAKLMCNLKFSNTLVKEVIDIVLPNLNNESWKIRQRSLNFFHIFIFGNIFEIEKIGYNFFDPMVNLLVDEQKHVSNEAFTAFSDFFRLSNKQNIKNQIDKFKQMVNLKKPEDKTQNMIGIHGLMCFLLAYPYEIFDFTEECINIIIKHKKKLAKQTQEFLKDFASKFLKISYSDYAEEDDKISEETINKLKDIANPYNYFA